MQYGCLIAGFIGLGAFAYFLYQFLYVYSASTNPFNWVFMIGLSIIGFLGIVNLAIGFLYEEETYKQDYEK